MQFRILEAVVEKINSEVFVFPAAEPVEDPPSVPVLNAAQEGALDSSDLMPG